jgi:hypothetical protein
MILIFVTHAVAVKVCQPWNGISTKYLKQGYAVYTIRK